MKTLLRPTLYVLLLAAGIGCHDTTQVDPTTITPEERDTGPNCTNYRIRVQRYKTADSIQSKPEAEMIRVEGKQYEIYLERETTFSYDGQGRLIQEIREVGDVSNTLSYSYTPTSRVIKILSVDQVTGRVLNSQSDFIPLNAQGLSSSYLYDADGYRISSSNSPPGTIYTWVNGNLDHFKSNAGYGSVYIDAYAYDLTRPALPIKDQTLGRGNRNLDTLYTLSSKGSYMYPDGMLYRRRFLHHYDRYGRVSRRIILENTFHNWSFFDYGKGIGVIDYIYECP
jgi:hypothetical protein